MNPNMVFHCFLIQPCDWEGTLNALSRPDSLLWWCHSMWSHHAKKKRCVCVCSLTLLNMRVPNYFISSHKVKNDTSWVNNISGDLVRRYFSWRDADHTDNWNCKCSDSVCDEVVGWIKYSFCLWHLVTKGCALWQRAKIWFGGTVA